MRIFSREGIIKQIVDSGRDFEMGFKDFVKYYSYGYVRIFVDQLVIAMFGASVAMGAGGKNQALVIGSSAFSVVFFLFLVAELTFRQGTEDSEKIALGRFKKNNFTGLYMGLIANIPNFILATAYSVLKLLGSVKPAGIVNVITKLMNGEYLGIFTIKVA